MLRRPGPAAVLLILECAGEDHSRGICVGMVTMATAGAAEPLCLTTRRIGMTADGTRLRAIRGGHLDQYPAGSRRLVRQLAGRLAPPLGKDRPVEAAFLRDFRAGLVDGALCGASHRSDLKVLNRDQAVALGQLAGEVVQEVGADTCLAGMQAGKVPKGSLLAPRPSAFARSAPPPRGFLAPCLASESAHPIALSGSKSGAGPKLPTGQGNSGGDSTVNSDGRPSVTPGIDDRVLAGQGRVPSKRVARDRYVLDFAHWGAGPPKPNPAEFWNAHYAPPSVEAADIDLSYGPRLDAEMFALPLSTQPRIPGLAPKEAAIGHLEVAQRLLQDIGVRLSQPRQSPLGRSEFRPCLLLVTEAATAHPPGGPSLLKSSVPHRPSASSPTRKCSRLIGGRVKAVAIADVLRIHRGEGERRWGQISRGTGTASCLSVSLLASPTRFLDTKGALR